MGAAQDAAASASTYSSDAQGYSTEAYNSQQAAAGSAGSAGDSASASAGSAQLAKSHSDDAGSSAQAAQSANTSAQGWSSQAQTYAGQAQGYAADADGSASAASASAQLVANFNPGANLVPNPSFNQGDASWTLFNDAFTGGDASIGSYVFHYGQSFGTSYVPLAVSNRYALQYASTMALQAVIYSGGIASNTFIRVGFRTYDSNGNQLDYFCVQTNVSQGWTRILQDANHGGAITPNANAVAFDILVDLASSDGNPVSVSGGVGATKIKLEPGSTCTPYTDDQVGAAIVQEASVRSSALTALATEVDTLSTNLGGLGATVQQQEGALSSVQGRTEAWWSVSAQTSQGGGALIEAQADGASGS